jgi:hypothetical protein
MQVGTAPQLDEVRVERKFAILPETLSDRRIIWLEFYNEKRQYRLVVNSEFYATPKWVIIKKEN